MAETIGKQQRTIEELQAELAKLKGEVLPFHFDLRITTVQPTVKVKSGCLVIARSGAVDTMTELLACHHLCGGCNVHVCQC